MKISKKGRAISASRQENNIQEIPKIEEINVTSVDMLDAVCKEPIVVQFAFKGKMWKIAGRLLTPAEKDSVDLILEQALPDLIAPAAGTDGEVKYDLRNPEHLKDKQKYKAQAKALALYLGYPIFAENARVKQAVVPKINIEMLTSVIQGLFTSEIQEELWRATIGPSRLWERANFF